MIYLASPYSHPDELIRRTRYLLAREFIAMNFPIHIYSPIVHYHEMAVQFNLPTEFAVWQAINFDMLRHAEQFWILNIDGWTESKGVLAEKDFAGQCGIPIRIKSCAS